MAFDRYSRDTILGEVVYNLDTQPELFQSQQKINATLNLKARQSLGDQRGQVLVSMAHNPQSQYLNFAIVKIKDLPVDNSIGLIGKIYL